ncbi:Thioredoxin-domain-containing protein [Mycena indigotica]|uniref:Thioredoxin-domain-containing protein n=1 Tax=Mycena indigotica TaxID=2126181 RepID=A0A8H6SHG6_9AGAR|nr:Thioredoxin-domain-containing protein [Mycena indigotica]KAF7298957.1 Thioredoxin-domain-containing protein [Mycena indigotica]
MSKPIEIQSVKQWNEIIEAANDKTLVVDFHATWCGPCKVIAPQFSQLAEQNPNVQFLRVDVDEHAAIAEFLYELHCWGPPLLTFFTHSQVRAMPTFYAIKNREVVGWASSLPSSLDLFSHKYSFAAQIRRGLPT